MCRLLLHWHQQQLPRGSCRGLVLLLNSQDIHGLPVVLSAGCASKASQDVTYIHVSSTLECMSQLSAIQQRQQRQSSAVTGADSLPAATLTHPAQQSPQQLGPGTATPSSSCHCSQGPLPPVGLLMPAGSAVRCRAVANRLA